MKRFLQYFWLFLFAIFVCWLGVFAYKLSSDTLVFAFNNQEKQENSFLQVAFDRPGFLSRVLPAGTLIDEAALRDSVFLDDKKLSAEDIQIIAKNWYIRIGSERFSEGETLKLSALEYNSRKKTAYNIPSDIIVNYSDNSQFFSVDFDAKNLKNTEFLLHLNEEKTFSPEYISFYSYYPSEDWLCYEDNVLWNYKRFSKIDAIIVSNENNFAKFDLPIDFSKNKQCIIAGYGGQIDSVLERDIGDFSLTGSLFYALSAADNLQSRVDFVSTSPLFSEEILENQESKNLAIQKILKKISISPDFALATENIEIFSDKISIIAPFQNGQKYRIHLTDFEDIYGRKISTHFQFEPKSDPYLQLKMDSQIFASGSEISAKIFATATPKNIYSLKICRLDVNGFSQISDVIASGKSENLENVYVIMDSPISSNCIKKDVSLDVLKTEINLQQFFEKEFPRGLYVLAFRDYGDISHFSEPVFPVTFQVGNIDIGVSRLGENLQFFTKNSSNLENISLEIFPKISDNISLSGAIVSQFGTGIILGATDKQGIISTSFSGFLSNNSQKEFSIVARRGQDFGFANFDFADDFLLKKQNAATWSNVNHQSFLPNQKISFFAMISSSESLSNQVFTVHLINEKNKKLQEFFIKPNEFGVLNVDFLPLDTAGGYRVELLQNSVKIDEYPFKISGKNIEHNFAEISFRGLNFDGNSPNNLREIANPDDTRAYYKNKYYAPIDLELTVRPQKNQKLAKNFSYKITATWWDFGANTEVIASGSADFDTENLGYLQISTDFSTFHNDVHYIAEVTTKDILTNQMQTQIADLFVTIPQDKKTFDEDFALDIHFDSELLLSGSQISAKILNWKNDFSQKYLYKILQKIDNSEVEIFSSAIEKSEIIIDTKNFESGEYILQVIPVNTEISVLPNNQNIKKSFFVQNKWPLSVSSPKIFTKKNSYDSWENVEFIAFTTYATGSIFFQYGNHDFLRSENIKITKNQTHFSFVVPETHSDIEIFAIFSDENWNENKLVQKTVSINNEKKLAKIHVWNLQTHYKNSDKIQPKISVKSFGDKVISGQIFVEILSEKSSSNNFLDSIFANISEQYFLKFKNISVETNSDLHKKNVTKNSEIAKKQLFAQMISFDSKGEITLDIPNIFSNWEYYLNIYSYSSGGIIGYHQSNFQIISDIEISHNIPKNVFPWDKIHFDVNVKNNLQSISTADVLVEFGQSWSLLTQTGTIILNVGNVESANFEVKIPNSWRGGINYNVSVIKNWQKISETPGSIFVDEIPTIWLNRKIIATTKENADILLSSDNLFDKQKSQIFIRIAQDYSVILPWLRDEIANTAKISDLDFWQSLYAKKMLENAKFDTSTIDLDSKKLQENYDFAALQDKDDLTILDEFIIIAQLQKSWFVFEKSFIENIQKYAQEKFINQLENKSFSESELVKILYFDAIFNEKVNENILAKIDINALNFADSLQIIDSYFWWQQEISQEYWERVKMLYEENSHNSLKNNFSDAIIFATMYLKNNKLAEAEEILAKIFEQKSSGISSLREKLSLVKMAIIHAQKKPKTPVNVSVNSSILSAKDLLNQEKKLASWNFSREKLSGNITIKSEKKIPIFYEITEQNYLEAPSIFAEKISENLKTSTKIEKIYENSAIDENGEFSLREEMSDNNLTKNQLYKATIIVDVMGMNDEKWEDVIIKMSIPSASEVFLPKNQDKNLQIFRKTENAIFLIAKGQVGEPTFEYSYYFRPKNSGSYLIPGNFVYFIETRELFANSSHQYFHVK